MSARRSHLRLVADRGVLLLDADELEALGIHVEAEVISFPFAPLDEEPDAIPESF